MKHITLIALALAASTPAIAGDRDGDCRPIVTPGARHSSAVLPTNCRWTYAKVAPADNPTFAANGGEASGDGSTGDGGSTGGGDGGTGGDGGAGNGDGGTGGGTGGDGGAGSGSSGSAN